MAFTLRSLSRASRTTVVALLALLAASTGFSIAAAGAAETPTSCTAEFTNGSTLEVTVTGDLGKYVAIDAVDGRYTFLGRQAVDTAGQGTQTFLVDTELVGTWTIRARTVDADGSKSARISCGEVTYLPELENNVSSPVACFINPERGVYINDAGENRSTYNRVVVEQFDGGQWVERSTTYVAGQGFITGLYVSGVEDTVEGPFGRDLDLTLPTRTRGEYKRPADGLTIASVDATVCGDLPSAPTLTAPSCLTKPVFYRGVNDRPIVGFKVTSGTASSDEFLYRDGSRVEIRYVEPDGTVAREAVTTKWKDVPSGTYAVQIRSRLFAVAPMNFAEQTTDWFTCGSVDVP